MTDAHIDHFMELSQDPYLTATMGWKPFISDDPDERERFMQQLQSVSAPKVESGETITFSIIQREDDRPIGYTALKGIDRTRSHGEVAIAIMEEEYRGLGYGTEAMSLMLAHAFDTLCLGTVYLTVFAYNPGAIRVYNKLGFSTVELLERSWKLNSGEYVDLIVMELSRHSD